MQQFGTGPYKVCYDLYKITVDADVRVLYEEKQQDLSCMKGFHCVPYNQNMTAVTDGGQPSSLCIVLTITCKSVMSAKLYSISQTTSVPFVTQFKLSCGCSSPVVIYSRLMLKHTLLSFPGETCCIIETLLHGKNKVFHTLYTAIKPFKNTSTLKVPVYMYSMHNKQYIMKTGKLMLPH